MSVDIFDVLILMSVEVVFARVVFLVFDMLVTHQRRVFFSVQLVVFGWGKGSTGQWGGGG